MSKNAAPGHGRLGPIKNRIQSLNPRTKRYTKANATTGKFLDGKADKQPFKSVRKAKIRK
ncbi:MAG: hypothetical protein JWN38_192 [Candidatus Saccharibacteria bacterium]|nr:hypothetical protein [Candidatus Saccharibacteria bacterium]